MIDAIKARIGELDAHIAAREAQAGYTLNVQALKAARAELQRLVDEANV